MYFDNLAGIRPSHWLFLLFLMCVPHLPIIGFRCQYQAYASAEGKNITLFAITVRSIDGGGDLKALLDLNEPPAEEEAPPADGEAPPADGEEAAPPPEEEEAIDTTACLTPNSPPPPEMNENEVPPLEPCPLGEAEDAALPCDETPNDAFNACTTIPDNVDGDCSPTPDEATMVMAECRSCTARLNPNGGGVKLTCYDCEHQRGDKTCHISQNDPVFKVQTKFFEVAGFGLANATSLG